MNEDDAGTPQIGQPLPGADEPSIEPDKLVRYALDPTHPVGRHKAVVFRQALGIEQADWEYLRDAIVEALPRSPITGLRQPRGARETYTWEVLVPIQGLGERAGRHLQVVTAWEIVDGRPVLVTLRVAPKSRQAPR